MGIKGLGGPTDEKPIVPSEKVKEGREFSLETLKDCHKYLPLKADQNLVSDDKKEAINKMLKNFPSLFKFLGT